MIKQTDIAMILQYLYFLQKVLAYLSHSSIIVSVRLWRITQVA